MGGYSARHFGRLLLGLCVIASAQAAPPATMPGAPDLTARVLVVRNANSPISKSIADDYARQRRVRNVVTVTCPDSAVDANAETIAFAAYQKDIETPVRAFLASHPSIDFIVLTKGIPIRLADAPQKDKPGRLALDSCLAALDYDKQTGAIRVDLTDPGYAGFSGLAWGNRYWNASEPFAHAKFGGYLVTRLDGYSEADAKALVAHALAAEKTAQSGKRPAGHILLDVCSGFGYADKAYQPKSLLTAKPGENKTIIVAEEAYNEYNSDMRLAALRLGARGIPVKLEATELFAGKLTGLMGYVSWGSNDQKYDAAAYHSLGFAPGAICETAVSTSARTFLPTQGGQSLIADLVAQGVTGAKGYTDEPLLQAVASPSILLKNYTSGRTLAESYYAASRFVGWQDVVIGDPLCRAYPATAK